MTGPTHEGVSAIQMLRHPDGRSFVAVDSLVDLFAEMASIGKEGSDSRQTLDTLAATFRPMSSYAELEANLQRDDDDGTTLLARRCVCGRPVIDAKRIAGTPIVIDAEPVPNGPLFPLRVDRGVPTVAPWKQTLDGIPGVAAVRLAEHACGGAS